MLTDEEPRWARILHRTLIFVSSQIDAEYGPYKKKGVKAASRVVNFAISQISSEYGLKKPETSCGKCAYFILVKHRRLIVRGN